MTRMRINTNISALNSWRNLSVTGNLMAKSLEKLSSGYRINRAADDAAGLAVSEKMRSQTSGLKQAARNAQDGISLIQTAEGALNESHAILQRMRELTVQAGNGTNKADDLQKIQEEITNLVAELDGIAQRTEFNGQKLIDGTLGAKVNSATVGSDLVTGTGAVKIADVTGAKVGVGYQVVATATSLTLTNADKTLSQTIAITATNAVKVGDRYNFDKIGVTLEAQATDISAVGGTPANGQFDVSGSSVAFQIGANVSQTLAVSVNAMGKTDLGVDAIDVTAFGTTTFDTQLGLMDAAISTVSSERSKLGAWQNRLEHTINNLQTADENLTAAESRIRDVDMALEMANFTRHQILQQAGTAMLAQANVSTQSVLKLLG
ncbi:MAG: flagellin [Bacillota bacterium]